MAKENKADMSCARIKKYTASDVSKAERHNERKNESYEKKEQKHSYLQARGFGRLLYGQIVQLRKSTKSILTNSTPTETDRKASLTWNDRVYRYAKIFASVIRACRTVEIPREMTPDNITNRAQKRPNKMFSRENRTKDTAKCKNICRQSAKKIAHLERFPEQL